jgi:hypothetical protein
LEDLGIHGRILNRRYGEREWPELIWLRIQTGGRCL